MNTQPSTPHPDPDVPWLDLSDGVPEWLAEYKIQGGRPLKDLYDNALQGHSYLMSPKDITMIIEELIRYREAYHAARRDLATALDKVKSYERDHEQNEGHHQAQQVAMNLENDYLRSEVARLTQVLDANGDVNTSLRQDRDYAVRESSSRVREIAELRREQGRGQAERDKLVTDRSRALAERDSAFAQVRTLREERDALLRAAAAMEREAHPLINPSTSERVQLLELDLASAHRSISTLKGQRDTYLAEKVAAERRAEEQCGRADRLNETLNRQQGTIDHATAKVDSLVDTLTQVTAERDQAWAENSTLVERTSELTTRADELVSRAAALEKEAERLNTRIVELETTMQQGAIKLRGVVDQVQADRPDRLSQGSSQGAPSHVRRGPS